MNIVRCFIHIGKGGGESVYIQKELFSSKGSVKNVKKKTGKWNIPTYFESSNETWLKNSHKLKLHIRVYIGEIL